MSSDSAASRRASRRTAARKSQRREILAAALALFARNGYERTSVHEVAKRAGFSVGHLYNLIGNKRALYDAVLIQEGEALLEVVQRATAPAVGRGLDRADRMIDAVLDFFAGHRDFFQIFLNETGGVPETANARFSEESLRLKQAIDETARAVFVDGVADGSFVAVDPDEIHGVVGNVVNGFVVRWVLAGGPGDLRDKAALIRRILWRGIADDDASRRNAQ